MSIGATPRTTPWLRSLYARLLLGHGLSLLLVVSVLISVYAWQSLHARTGDFDVQMSFFARGLVELAAPLADAPPALERAAREIERIYVESSIVASGGPIDYAPVYRLLRPDSSIALRRPASGPLPFARVDLGFDDTTVDGRAWRVYGTVGESGLLVQVAEPLDLRWAMLANLLLSVLTPLLLAVPLIGVVAWLATRWAWRPMQALQAEIRARRPQRLEPLQGAAGLRELAPLIAELNELLAHTRSYVARERALVDDAAHQLRTPLAALAMQADALARAPDESSRTAATAALQGGVRRASSLLAHLLALARVDAAAAPVADQPFDLCALLQERLAAFGAAALAKDVDLSLEVASDARARGDATALGSALDALLDNALNYVGRGGCVRVRAQVAPDQTCIEVADDGPGLAPELRAHAGARFWRGPQAQGDGSGLGLAVATRLLAVNGGTLALADGLPHAKGCGLAVRLCWPARAG
jgi:two-component system OmpR family sensor kinase